MEARGDTNVCVCLFFFSRFLHVCVCGVCGVCVVCVCVVFVCVVCCVWCVVCGVCVSWNRQRVVLDFFSNFKRARSSGYFL